MRTFSNISIAMFLVHLASSLLGGAATLGGCGGGPLIGVAAPPPQPLVTVQAPVVEADAPVVQDPSVVLIDVEPPPDLRVYYYDPGYPPGCYFYGGYFYYGRYRYPHDLFVNRYVADNLRDHHFMDRNENMELARAIEAQHRTYYARTGGHVGGHTAGPHDVPDPRKINRK